MARIRRRQAASVICTVLLAALSVRNVDAVNSNPGGDREAFRDRIRQQFGHSSSSASGRSGRTLKEDFDPTISSRKYCNPKKYPDDDKKVKAITFDTGVTDLRWAHEMPYEDKVVYALLESESGFGGGRVWRSLHYGDPGTWEDITKNMQGAFPDNSGEFFELTGVAEMHVHMRNPDKVLFQGAGLQHWIQEGIHKPIEAVDTPGKTVGYGAEVKMHPYRAEWVLSKVRRNHCLTHGVDKWCAYDVFLSQDFGRTWKNLTQESHGRVASFIDFEWGAKVRASKHKTDAVPDETIFATVYTKQEHMPKSGPFGHGWDPNVRFVASNDFFKSAFAKEVQCGNMFEVIAHKVFLALPTKCGVEPNGEERQVPEGADGNDQVTLYVSEDEGISFTEVCLPVTIEDKGYNIIRTHDGENVFLVVDHDEEDELESSIPAGNVYSSGHNDSTVFSLSMRRNFRRNFVVDFVRVEGIPGAYLANQLDDIIKAAHGTASKDIKFEKFVQTQVSINSGAAWDEIKAPAEYRHDECNACDKDGKKRCSLHLHGPSSWFWTPEMHPSPSLYSHENAPGIVLATGNTGEFLDTSGERVCTWLSQDGGVTWSDIANHAAIYEFGDHGNIVVIASFMTATPTDRVYFSIDDGMCWNTVVLEEAVLIENIRVEPRGASHIFMVHGSSCFKDQHEECSANKDDAKKGKLFAVDIRELRGKEHWETCSEEDYIDWSPPNSQTCLLGRNYTLQRQKPESYCFNAEEYDRPEYRWTQCPCGRADFACEFGYEPDDKGGCKAIEGVTRDMCPPLQHYVSSSKNLRLVHGDHCAEKEEFLDDADGIGHAITWNDKHDDWSLVPNERDNQRAAASSHSPSSASSHNGGGSNGWWAVLAGLLLGAGVLAVGACVWWGRCASEYTKASVEDCLAPALRCCCGLFDAVSAKVSGGGASRAAQDDYFQPLDGPVGLELGEDDRRSPPMLHQMR